MLMLSKCIHIWMLYYKMLFIWNMNNILKLHYGIFFVLKLGPKLEFVTYINFLAG